jgi:hypothetical protein
LVAATGKNSYEYQNQKNPKTSKHVHFLPKSQTMVNDVSAKGFEVLPSGALTCCSPSLLVTESGEKKMEKPY